MNFKPGFIKVDQMVSDEIVGSIWLNVDYIISFEQGGFSSIWSVIIVDRKEEDQKYIVAHNVDDIAATIGKAQARTINTVSY